MSGTPHELTMFYGERVDPLIESMFPDGFLNFGYWKNITSVSGIDTKERIESGKELYRQVLDELRIAKSDKLLEVGCGRGRGSAVAMTEYSPAEVDGVDAVGRQVEKARIDNAEIITGADGRLSYRQGSADALPYTNEYFDKVYSVEAMVHFPDIYPVMMEIARISKHHARVAIASIFSPTRKVTADHWVDVLTAAEAPPSMIYAHPVSDLVDACYQAGFSDVAVRSIGAYVWRGFNLYLDRLDVPRSSRRRKWLTAYECGVLDYYIVTASK